MKGDFITVSLIILAIIFCNEPNISQENPAPPFTIGTYFGLTKPEIQTAIDEFDTSGMNTIIWHADGGTQNYISDHSLIAYNSYSADDWICYYATCYYSKWEAEENQTNANKIGVKHKYGQAATWKYTPCWSTLGVTAATDSLVYGPHYRQEKKYAVDAHGMATVQYVPRFRMALNNDHNLGSDEPVCRIKVTVRHIKYVNGEAVDTLDDILKSEITLKVSDFPSNGSFKEFYFGLTPLEQIYTYETYTDNIPNIPDQDTSYADYYSDTGVEFWVEWLRNDNLCTLYIDNIEVYDYDGWSHYLDDPVGISETIKNYAEIRTSGWPNIKYWYGKDEPGSIDCYTPMHVVDSLVNDKISKRVISSFYPNWRILVNGDSQLVNYYRKVKPEHLIVDYYPFSIANVPVRWQDLQSTREQFQIASFLDSTFWYVAQTFGFKDSLTNQWKFERRPTPSELNSTIMLALAYGAKGIIFWNYDSYRLTEGGIRGYYDCIVGLPEDDYPPSDIYYYIQQDLAPRLSGTLGNKLKGLTYNGHYISARYFIPSDDLSQQSYDYLTLPYYQSASTMNWHVGFFNREGFSDDKYFFLVNLLPLTNKSVSIKVTAPDQNHINYRFRNYEGYFDTTFTGTQFTYTLHHTAGEGYLYEVAPVVKYGGKLYSSETITGTLELHDDMTIENGVTLTVNGTYNCYANIYIKGTGKIKTVNGGTINFYNSKGIIAKDSPQITGTSLHKLTLDFNSTTSGSGITLLQGSTATISYCVLKNAVNLISSNTSQYQTNINHCDFQNTSGYAISLSGSATRVPAISYCTFTNTDYGIFSAGQSSITVSYNTFTNNKIAMSLSQVPSVQIFSNTVTSNLGNNPGVFLNSCGGNLSI